MSCSPRAALVAAPLAGARRRVDRVRDHAPPGLLAGHLPGFSETPAIAVLVGACCVSVLRLPLSSVMIASLLSVNAGLAVAPLVILAVVAAYLTSEALSAYVDARVGRAAPAPAAPEPEPQPA